jgi:hypothetical protein
MSKPLSDKVFDFLRRYLRSVGFKDGRLDALHFSATINDIPEAERVTSPMHRAFYENKGAVVHKWRGYFDKYDRHLSRFRDTPVRILEIGVFKGGSLQMWRNYFGGDATIFGIDIDENCSQYNGVAGQVRIGSQDDPSFLKSVLAEMGGADVVIDDGSHIARHQCISFNILFPELDPSGVYICEDLHTAYWRGIYEGGYRRRSSFIEFAKRLVDDIHADFHRHGSSLKDAHKVIDGIHFYNSMVVIEKAPQLPPLNLWAPNLARNDTTS